MESAHPFNHFSLEVRPSPSGTSERKPCLLLWTVHYTDYLYHVQILNMLFIFYNSALTRSESVWDHFVCLVVLLLRGLLPTPFKSFSLQKNPLLPEMLVTRLPVSCHLCSSGPFFFYRLKQKNFAGNFPVASRSLGQPFGPIQLLVVKWWKEVFWPPALTLLTQVPFLLWKVFPMDVTKNREHFAKATEWSKHQIAYSAQTSHLLHSLIFNSRGKDLTDFYCTFLSYGSLPHSSFVSALCFASFLSSSSTAE